MFEFCSEESQFLFLRLDNALQVLCDFPVAIVFLSTLIFPCCESQSKPQYYTSGKMDEHIF